MTEDAVVAVGMACRYPDAPDPAALWQNVMSRRRSFRPMPRERLPLDEYGGSDVDRTYLRGAAVLDGWTFDRERFRVPGRTYRAVDLTHWLALDVSAAALAHAGVPDGDGLDRSRVGVVLGNSLTGEFSRAVSLRTRWPYVGRALAAALAGSALTAEEQRAVLADAERRFKAPFPEPSEETLAGALANTIAGRICNYFDFQGLGYTVDGACASSLLAVATAADAVASGRLDVALAGGVDLSLDPFELIGFARVGALAEGDMRIYDARPTGFLPGEGCGVVVLCRESYAVKHGLHVYARLLGWAASSDGNGGLTRPELTGQRLALRRAYAAADVDPADVALVEGHGTGTAVGDETELRALLDVRGAPARPGVLGSIKANIGHTKAAAGVAGLLKAVLALDRQVLPPTTGCEEPHPLLRESTALRIAAEAEPWPVGERRAAVSAMGFGGVNTHVVLAGAAATTRRSLSRRDRLLSAAHPGAEILVCGASSPSALAAELIRLGSLDPLTRAEITDLAAANARTYDAGATARFAAVVDDDAGLRAAVARAREALDGGTARLCDPDARVFLATGAPWRIGLLFPGQASPTYAGPGALGPLLDRLPPGYADPGCRPRPGEVAGTEVAQPAILRASLAGLRWLTRLGLLADGAVGHSVGEIAALVWAGALSDTEAYRLVQARGAAMAAASAGVPAGMAGLRCDVATARGLLRGDAVVAADNAAAQVVVAGTRTDVEQVLAAAAAAGVDGTWLAVRHAFHSPLMASARDALRSAAADVDWRAPAGRVVSTVTARGWSAGDDPVERLTEQLTAPVRFREALAALDADLLVEVGPGRVLTGLAGDRPAVSLDAGSASAAGIATATAALFAAGAIDDVRPWFADRYARPFDVRRPRQFLMNPCEAGVAATGDAVPAAVPVTEPVDVDVTDVTGVATADEGDVATDAPPIEVVAERVAAAAELPVGAIRPTDHLLGDLHLNSLRVGQLAAEVAVRLGRALPAAPLALASSTVEEFTDTMVALPAADRADDLPVPGVAAWVRAFAYHLVAAPPVPEASSSPENQLDWQVIGEHPLMAAVRSAFPPASGRPPARVLALPPGRAEPPVEAIVAALRDGVTDGRPLVVLHHGGPGGIGAAAGRSLAAERPDNAVLVVEVPADEEGIATAAREAARHRAGYAEVIYPSHRSRTVPVVRPLEIAPRPGTALPLGPGDVCVVSGGAKGIASECAVALAAATGAMLVLLGRSDPADEEVAATVRRIEATGAAAAYEQLDVTDGAAVATCLRAVRQQHGPVRVLLHAAGRNEPVPIAGLTAERLTAALAPKAGGLENLLAAVDLAELRSVVTFGSVIARTGMPGEAHYAVANEWLGRRCAELSVEVPHVRWLNVEWSAWSGTGMGVRLGVLDRLIREGLSPIPAAEGAAVLLRLLASAELPTTVLVAGRVPDSPALLRDEVDAGAAGGRFVDGVRARTTGVELVTEAEVSLGTDPYLDDHRIDGTAVLPAVFGLEAMAQVAVALGAKPLPAVFRDVRLAAPITVPDHGTRVVRVAALAREDGEVEVVTRSDETQFVTDHFAGVFGSHADEPPAVPEPAVPTEHEATGWYGPLFFHGPRFQRVDGFGGLSADRCTASVHTEPAAHWFGSFEDQRLELGDPGARDAVLHALQVCVPDRRVLPVGAQRITVFRRPAGRLTIEARQRAESPGEYVFDVVVCDAERSVVEEWQGLRLREVGRLDGFGPWPDHADGGRGESRGRWPEALAGPLLARSLRRAGVPVPVDLTVATATRGDRDRTAAVAAWLAGVPVAHAPDGRPVQLGPDAGFIGAAHLGDLLLVGQASRPLAVDWERADAVPPPSPAGDGLATTLSARTGEGPGVARVRVWTALEVCGKLGSPPDAPLTVADAPPVAGWTRLRSGPHELFSSVVPLNSGDVVVCVGLG